MKEEIKVQTAAEILANRVNPITIEDVMRRFNYEHENHANEIVFVGYALSNELMGQLFSLGFKYRKHYDPVGLTCHVISLT